MTDTETGRLTILNVGAGDIALSFKADDTAESEKAIGILKDMQRRGYLIAVQLPDGTYTRATSIDAARGRYIITVPDILVPVVEAIEAELHRCACGCGAKVAPGKTWVKGHHSRKRAPQQTVSVPVTKTKALGVARSAGG